MRIAQHAKIKNKTTEPTAIIQRFAGTDVRDGAGRLVIFTAEDDELVCEGTMRSVTEVDSVVPNLTKSVNVPLVDTL